MSLVLTIAAAVILAASALELAERDIGLLTEALGTPSLVAPLVFGLVIAARVSAAVFMLAALAGWVAGGAA